LQILQARLVGCYIRRQHIRLVGGDTPGSLIGLHSAFEFGERSLTNGDPLVAKADDATEVAGRRGRVRRHRHCHANKRHGERAKQCHSRWQGSKQRKYRTHRVMLLTRNAPITTTHHGTELVS